MVQSTLSVAACAAAGAFVVAQSLTTQVNGQEAIIGGTEVKEGDYHFLTSLQTAQNRHFCGGSLIAPSTVLTAAHCVSNGQTNFKIKLGTTDLAKSDEGVYVVPKKVYVHEKYDSRNIRNDIAVVSLSAPVDASFVTPINRDVGIDTPAGDAIVAGWGLTVGGGSSTPKKMMEVELPIVLHATCKAANNVFNQYLKDEMICTGYNDGNKSACNGDSGGPLFAGTKQLGLVSWGIRGCTSYSVFTRLNSYDEWLSEKLTIIEGETTNPPVVAPTAAPIAEGETASPTVETTEPPVATPPPVTTPPTSEPCTCIGEGLPVGNTCRKHNGVNFNWCYSDRVCPGSTPSNAYPGYHWFRCQVSRLDIFQQFETTVSANNAVDSEVDLSNEFPAEAWGVKTDDTKGITPPNKVRAKSAGGSNSGVLAGAGLGAGIAFIGAGAAFIVYKRSKDENVNRAIERVEMERRSMGASMSQIAIKTDDE